MSKWEVKCPISKKELDNLFVTISSRLGKIPSKKELIEQAAMDNIKLPRYFHKVYYKDWDDFIQKSGLLKLYTTIDVDKRQALDAIKRRQTESKYKQLVKEESFQDEILKEVRSLIPKLPTVKVPKVNVPKKGVSDKEDIVLNFSDTHIGEIVKFDETMGLAEYDFDIFKQRLEYMSDTIHNLIKNKLVGYKFNKLWINMLGDMVSGLIHDELVEYGEATVIEWVFGGALVIAQFLMEMAQLFPEIEVTCVVGNHGRMHRKKRFKKRYVNWDYILYETIASYCKDQKNIIFDIPRSFFTVKNIKGYNCLIVHGDDIKSWNGIPFYGIDRMARNFNELLRKSGKSFDYIFLGHFHRTGLLDNTNGSIMINSSVIGGNEFSIGALGQANEPKQLFFGMHPKYGDTFLYNIKLIHAPKKKTRYIYDPSVGVSKQLSVLDGD